MTRSRTPTVASPSRWPPLAVSALRTFYLAVLVWLVVWAAGATLIGRLQPLVISSGSMAPGINAGDLVLASAPDPSRLTAGRVVTFVDPADAGRLITHRIEAVLDDGSLRTRGDANPTPDSTPVPVGAVIGEGRLLVPLLGLPLVWLRDGEVSWFAAWAVLTAVALLGPAVGRRGRSPAPMGAPATAPAPAPARTPVAPAAAAPLVPDPLAVGIGEVWHARQRPRSSWSAARRVVAASLPRAGAVVGAALLAVTLPAAPVQAWASVTHVSGSTWAALRLSPPTNLTAKATCRALILGGVKVELAWTAAPSGDGYRIWRATSAGGPYSHVGTVAGRTTTTFTEEPLSGSTTYHYVVRSTQSTWSSPDGASVAVTTPLCL